MDERHFPIEVATGSPDGEIAALRADMATVRLFLTELARDERWHERALAILRVIER